MQLGNRYSQHSFSKAPSVNIARSSFDRSHQVKTTMEFDLLTPVYIDEILPGDTVNLNMKAFARLATQTVPVMDNMYMDVQFFFTPNRLVWENWERFNGAQDNPTDTTDYILPTLTAPSGGFLIGSIFDQVGLPTGISNLKVNNVLPLRSYNLIFNEWYRDQNLQTSYITPKDDGPDNVAMYTLINRNKAHDYFTSCLPWPQKGPSVELPLGTTAQIVTNGQVPTYSAVGGAFTNRSLAQRSDGTINAALYGGPVVGAAGTATNVIVGNQSGLQADLSTATAATINQLREAFMMQSLFELDARGGTRYVEILQAHFNVTSPDFRLQRPEYLGGGRVYFNVHTVAQTSESATSPQANLAGFGTAMASDNQIGFTKSFTEHGYVIGLASARADLTYQQGMNRMWNRKTRYDFFWPKLQELGEQAVLKKEIYALGTAQDEAVFGYQERYAEYRYKPSEIRGLFRSTAPSSLDVWHLAEEFSGPSISLNGTWMFSKTPIQRTLAVTNEIPIIMDAFFQIKHARPMVAYSTPATIGRF